MFNTSIRDSFTLSYDSLTRDRNFHKTAFDHQLDGSSAQNINFPKNLLIAHQAVNREAGGKLQNNGIFDTTGLEKYFVEIDGIIYPKDSILVDFVTIDYKDGYRGLIFLQKLLVNKY